MKYFLLILVFVPSISMACGESSSVMLWYYRTFTDSQDAAANSVQVTSDKITIKTKFISELIKNPSIETFDKYRYELFYLVAKNNQDAEVAGLKSLALILRNPKYVIECDRKVSLYNVEEIAINLSRSEHLYSAYCRLTEGEQQIVSKYFVSNPQLYQVDVDAPWDYDACK